MSITAPTPAATPPATDTMRRTSLTAGILYLITFVSMPTLALYQGFHDRAEFVIGAGSDTGVLWGALSEVVVAIAGIGTAVVLFRWPSGRARPPPSDSSPPAPWRVV